MNLYVWYPTGLSDLLQEGVTPDLGHASLEVVDADGMPVCYASFWPEMDSLLGQFTSLLKPRKTRNPSSFAEECDPAAGFMQRKPDVKATFPGLNEALICRGWRHLHEIEYDFFSWNCSNVTRYLLIHAMTDAHIERLGEKLECSEEDLRDIRSTENETLATRLRRLSLTGFIRCIPDDLVRLADVYNNTIAIPVAPRHPATGK